MESTMQKLSYDAFLTFWRIVINIFFREIRPRGAFNIPRNGPLILVAAPHNNQFLDPLLLMSETFREARRRVHCLIAAKSMKQRAIGFFSSMQGSIPVARAADDAKAGTGFISISNEDPCLVIGYGTKFLSELAPKRKILLPKTTNSMLAEVIEVLSDSQVRVKKEFGGDSGKGTSRIREKLAELGQNGRQGLEFKILPFIDQQQTYRHVYESLKDGQCIGIFPEGEFHRRGSHDRTDLLPLKAGVTLMALGAMANNPSLKVKIVPVGLSYFHAHRFRSRAVIEFGSALEVPDDLVELFREGGEKKREACSKLLNIIYDGLKTVTLRAPDYDTLMLIQAARRLYETPGQHLTLGQVVELNKRFMEGYEHFKNEPRVQQLRSKVLRYNRLVRDLGLRDHQVPRARRAAWKTLGLTLYRIGLLIVWTALALPGVVLNGPIFLLASVISRRKAKQALAGSTVKIAGRDVLATWKILVSVGAVPILYSFYGFLAVLIATRANASLRIRALVLILTLVALPCIGYGALKFGEAGLDVFKSLPPLIVSLVPGQHKHLRRLKQMRTELSNELSEMVSDLGPKLYDDFDQWRILVPSASVPPSGISSGIWRRKSNVGAMDAQGNLLVHPMTWLDERLFGWSRSARKGTSAWDGSASNETSRHGTPESSDDEDVGDYDDIAGLLRGYEVLPHETKSRSKSTRSSYADLQLLRRNDEHPSIPSRPKSRSNTMLGQLAPVYLKQDSPLSPYSQMWSHTEHATRDIPRVRRASLSEGVPVERIRELNPQEAFKDATENINHESLLKHPEKTI